MEQFRREMTSFVDAVYESDKKVLVYGDGLPGARVMLVGEAPGEQETLQRRPFVGKAGKNLDEFLRLAELPRRELYITNVVKFRPTRLSPAGRTINRTPTQEEIRLFLPWLQREIALVNPKIVVTLGNVPLGALTERKAVIGEAHGKCQTISEGRPLYPMYHPASLIYNPSLREAYTKDILALAQWLKDNI